MAVLLVSMYAGIGLNTDISKGIADRFRSLPIWRPAPVTGALLGISPATCSLPAWWPCSGS
jgi:ABC-2 type transport system permease protein